MNIDQQNNSKMNEVMESNMSNNKRQFQAKVEYQDDYGRFERVEITVEATNQNNARDIALDQLQTEWFLNEDEIDHLSIEAIGDR